MKAAIIAETHRVLDDRPAVLSVRISDKCVAESDNFIAAAMKPATTEGIKSVDIFVQPEDGVCLLEMASALGAGIGGFLREHTKANKLQVALAAAAMSFLQGLFQGGYGKGVSNN